MVFDFFQNSASNENVLAVAVACRRRGFLMKVCGCPSDLVEGCRKYFPGQEEVKNKKVVV